MDNFTSLQGPVEKTDGKLVLCIPLSAGGGSAHRVQQGDFRGGGRIPEDRYPRVVGRDAQDRGRQFSQRR